MPSRPTPSPSKNALQALRHLAFSHPTIFAGAIGSACCAAIVSCEAQRRVRLAEKIVSTKQTLRSISDGRGNSRVARMFEAAEKGEDFLLDPRSAQRRRRVRRYSALAVARDDDADTEALRAALADMPVRAARKRRTPKSMVTAPEEDKTQVSPSRLPSMENASASHPSVGGQRDHDQPRQIPSRSARPVCPTAVRSSSRQRVTAPNPGTNGDSHTIGSVQDAVDSPWTMRREPRNSAAAQRIHEASMVQHKHPDQHVYERVQKVDKPSATTEALEHDAIIESHRIRNVQSTEPIRIRRTKSSRDGSGVQSQPKTTSRRADVDYADLFKALRLPNLIPPTEASDDPFQWKLPATDFLEISTQDLEEKSEAMADEAETEERPIDGWASFFSLTYRRIDAARQNSKGQIKSSTDSGEKTLKPFIGTLPEERNLTRKIRKYLASDAPDALSKACDAFSGQYDPNIHGILPTSAVLLLRRLLSDETTYVQAAAVLNWSSPLVASFKTRSRSVGTRIIRYLQTISEMSTDPAVWKEETHRVLRCFKACSLEVPDRSLEMIIRMMCWIDQPSEAEAQMKAWEAEFELEHSVRVDAQLVHGYASRRDWVSVDRLMTQCSDSGLARERPMWFSNVFREVFRLHLQDRGLNASYDYLINAMAYWKLPPTSAVTTLLAVACVKARKLDNLKEWVEATRQLWPRLQLGFGLPRMACELSQAWNEIEARCEDIKQTIEAMVIGATDDPFSPSIRSIVRDAIADAIYRASMAVLNAAHLGQDIPQDQLPPRTLSRALPYAHQLLTDSEETVSQEHEAALEHLSQELHAIVEIDDMFGGERRLSKPSSTYTHSVEHDEIPYNAESQETSTSGLPDHLPSLLRSGNLPHKQILWPMVAEEYARCQRLDLPPPHHLLENVVKKLHWQWRILEAVELLRSVHDSPYVTGRPGGCFPSALYTAWLDLSRLMRANAQSRYAMWALLDVSRHVTLTAAHTLMIRRCRDNENRAVERYGIPAAGAVEAQYLVDRFQKVRWVQLGFADNPPKLKPWRTWEAQIAAMA